MRIAYAGMAEFADAGDYELARMVLQSMKEYKLSAVDRNRFDRIQEKLSEMDWEGIRSILKEA